MKVVHICLSLGKGGAEKLLVDNLPIHKKAGIDVSIIQLSSLLEEKSYIEKMKKEKIEVHTLGKGGFINPLYILRLIKIIKKNKYDVLHIHLFPTLYYIALAKFFLPRSIKYVVTEHSVSNGRTNLLIFKLLEPYIYKRYNAIIAISKNVETMLKTRLPKIKNKIFLINNGVDVHKFLLAKSYDKTSFLSDLGFTSEKIILMMISRFSEPKNQNVIIKALQYLPSDYILIFIGDGPKLQESQDLTKTENVQNRVRFLGFRTDISELMKTADINILSTKFEGFSGVTLEALSSGKTFIGSDVVGINDIVPSQDNLFQEGNPEALAQKIKILITDVQLQKKTIEKNLVHVEKYDSRIMINKHLELYRTI